MLVSMNSTVFKSLNSQNIDAIIDSINVYLVNQRVSKKEQVAFAYSIDEVLLKYRELYGEDIKIRCIKYQVFGQPRVRIELSCPEYNPFEKNTGEEDDDLDMMKTNLLSYLDKSPEWKYSNHTNILLFSLDKSKAETFPIRIMLGVAVGVVLGLLLKYINIPIMDVIVADYIKPLNNVYAGLNCVMAVLITFFAVSLSIANVGSVSAISTVGKTLFGRICIIGSIITLLFIIGMVPFITLSEAQGTSVSIKNIYDILLSFIPTNFVQPFIDFNAAQLILIGVMFGIPMLTMGSKSDNLKNMFDEANTAAILTNSFFNMNLMPIFVGFSIFVLIYDDQFSYSGGSLKILLLVLAAYLLLLGIYSLYTKIKTGCKLSALMKLFFPTFISNLSSANYGASFVMSWNALFETGIKPNYINVAHNFGGVIYKPGYSFIICGAALVMGDVAGVDISISWLMVLFILALILTVSLPTIPGSAVAGLSVVFAELGIPSAYLATAIAAYAILDFAAVAVNGYILQCEILIGADELGRIDKSINKKLWVS